jgi:Hemerythrin HHE cation binding domain
MARGIQSKQDKASGTESPVDRNAGASGRTAGASAGASAIEMLKQDHRRVESLFEQIEQSGDDEQKEGLVERICGELILHMRLEEEIFYPACRKAGVDEDTMDEAQVEHDGAKIFVNDLLDARAGGRFWDAKVSVLKELIKHHVAEEEKPGDGTFAQAKGHGIDDAGLAEQLKHRKGELQRRAAGKQPIRAVSFDQEKAMPRYGYPERDDRGRFMSDDDREYGRSRYRDDDDERYGRRRGHGGWYGDSEGHSEAARERWGEGRYGQRYEDDERYGRGRYEDDYDRRYERERDERGRFMSDDDDRGYRGRSGHGGWFGDPREHAEASRMGWEERRGDYDRRYGRSRNDDDDDRRHGGHGGWYGDPRGHAEASRRGWQHRR